MPVLTQMAIFYPQDTPMTLYKAPADLNEWIADSDEVRTVSGLAQNV